MNVIAYESKNCSADLLEGLGRKATSNVSDVMGRYQGESGLRSFHKRATLIGIAVTVQATLGDNLVIHAALEFIRPDDVLVVDGGDVLDRTLVGGCFKGNNTSS